jgi:hypothetical protein
MYRRGMASQPHHVVNHNYGLGRSRADQYRRGAITVFWYLRALIQKRNNFTILADYCPTIETPDPERRK